MNLGSQLLESRKALVWRDNFPTSGNIFCPRNSWQVIYVQFASYAGIVDFWWSLVVFIQSETGSIRVKNLLPRCSYRIFIAIKINRSRVSIRKLDNLGILSGTFYPNNQKLLRLTSSRTFFLHSFVTSKRNENILLRFWNTQVHD